MQKILLALNGKNIVLAKIVEDHDGSFDWVSEAYPSSDTRSYVVVDYDDKTLAAARKPMAYYDVKAKAIKDMKVTQAKVDKTTIENDGVDTVTYTITTTEPMSVIVQQEIGDIRENGIFALIPDNGKIVLSINSDCIGTLRFSAVGDTKYAEPLEVAVV